MKKYTAISQLSDLEYRQRLLNEQTIYLLKELINEEEITFDRPIYDGSTKITGINTEYVICEVKWLNATYPIEEIDFDVAVKIINVLINKLHN